MVGKQKERRLPSFWSEDRLLSFFLAFLVLMTWIRRENGGRNISGALLTAGRSTF
jgi:hypothetical protein